MNVDCLFVLSLAIGTRPYMHPSSSQTFAVPNTDDWNPYIPMGIKKIPEEGGVLSIQRRVFPWQHVNEWDQWPANREAAEDVYSHVKGFLSLRSCVLLIGQDGYT